MSLVAIGIITVLIVAVAIVLISAKRGPGPF